MPFKLPRILSFALSVSIALTSWPSHARLALVIGNSNYAQGALINPINDAQAVARALAQSGFDVELLVNQNRESMLSSIKRFGDKLAGSKQPSVFYFAGHAIQIDWRNYLLPIDVNIRTALDVKAQSVDLNDLLQQLSRAAVSNGGASNIILLDACRDNPFSKTANAARGLTQIDAPIGKLLAYATSPGNVALDAGIGDNGLYTENLIREMVIEGVKIEDVLKRVRLAVRLQSKGQQIPWESTSLEEDFYFKLPKSILKPSREDAEREFEAELEAWVKVRSADNIQDIEKFIRRYPSGKFSELAQYRLDALFDREKKIIEARRSSTEAEAARRQAEAEIRRLQEREQEIHRALANADAETQRAARIERESLAMLQLEAQREAEAAKGREAAKIAGAASRDQLEQDSPKGLQTDSITAILNAAIEVSRDASRPSNFPAARLGEIRQGWQVGDLMVYREQPLTGIFKFETTVRQRAYGVSSMQVAMRSGQILDHASYPKGDSSSSSSNDMQVLIRDYQVGKSWSSRFKRVERARGATGYWVEASSKVVSREEIQTPAGKFDTFRVQVQLEDLDGPRYKFNQTWWIDTLSRKPVAYEKIEKDSSGTLRDHRKGMLIAFENDGNPRID